MTAGTGNECVTALNLVHKAMSLKKLQRAINSNRRMRHTLARHSPDNVIGTNSTVVLCDASKDVASLLSQPTAVRTAHKFSA